MTAAPRDSVPEVIASLEDEFAGFAAAFARGDYLLWLGSGISRDVVPGVYELLERMLDYLRAKVDLADPGCRFRGALDEVLDVAGVPDAARASIDLTMPVQMWPERSDILARLVDRYSDVLDVQVPGEPEDFLVWTGLGIPTTYGAPELLPDVEHLCVAILMLEGVVRSAPTTNWDGLVEAAMKQLVADADRVLRVIVQPADFRGPDRRAELLKFHGCAVRAAANEADYRPRLIARKSQISGWTTKPENQMMKNRLEHLFASRPALVIGLSAQDANIHVVLHQANQGLSRSWPESPPAVVLAERNLSHHHKHVLRVTYGASYAANVNEIASSAVLGAYAKPVLVGLVLYTLADKLAALAACTPGLAFTDAEFAHIKADINFLRDTVSQLAGTGTRPFLDAFLSQLTLVLSVFRSGEAPPLASMYYQPISAEPIESACHDPDFPTAAFGRLALAVSALGRGLRQGSWELSMGRPSAPEGGVIRLATRRQSSRVFIVRNARATSQLELDGLIDPDDDEVLVLLAEAPQPTTTRSPRGSYGRTGRTGARHVDLEEIFASVGTADELLDALKLEAAL